MIPGPGSSVSATITAWGSGTVNGAPAVGRTLLNGCSRERTAFRAAGGGSLAHSGHDPQVRKEGVRLSPQALTAFAAALLLLSIPYASALMSSTELPVLIGEPHPDPLVLEDSDSYEGCWHFWWTARAISMGVDPRHCPLIYPPEGASLAYQHIGWIDTYIFALSGLGGSNPVLSYNLSLYAGTLLTALFGWLLARSWGLSPAAALLTALMIAWLPARTARVVQHYQLADCWTLTASLWLCRSWIKQGTLRPVCRVRSRDRRRLGPEPLPRALRPSRHTPHRMDLPRSVEKGCNSVRGSTCSRSGRLPHGRSGTRRTRARPPWIPVKLSTGQPSRSRSFSRHLSAFQRSWPSPADPAARFVNQLVVGALQEGRVNRHHRLDAFAGESGGKGQRMLFGNADIEIALGEFL